MLNDDFTITTTSNLSPIGLRKIPQGYCLRVLKDNKFTLDYIESCKRLKSKLWFQLVLSPHNDSLRETIGIVGIITHYEYNLDNSNTPMWIDIYIHETIDREPPMEPA